MSRNDPAFPCKMWGQSVQGGPFGEGFTKLEFISGLAMQGMLSNPDWSQHTSAQVAKEAIVYADALLAELEAKT